MSLAGRRFLFLDWSRSYPSRFRVKVDAILARPVPKIEGLTPDVPVEWVAVFRDVFVVSLAPQFV
jgi:hypothetical protein